MKKTTAITIAALTALSTAALAGEGGTDGLVLGDGNSTASFDNTTGQYSWIVDGEDQLYAQEFYFRLAGYNDEVNINTLSLLGQALTDTNTFTDDRYDSISTLWGDSASGLEIETTFTLRGGADGSGLSDLAEQISLTNNGNETIVISFFQYVDFDLGDDSGDDFGMIVDGNIAQQADDDFYLSETVVTPAPHAFQMGSYTEMSDLWENGMIDDLNGDSSYEGDVAWAFQWNITLEVGESFLISKNKSIVPAPGSLALLAGAGLISTRRRRA
jgi:hypothetical protein